ncbi:DUF6491 family protein [Dyella subtropica]|uniref:DUF6491 family protein n=1 Tax=Dyella subtropica TaxID=2992127 RepID=UPI002254C1F9|nr:DUF6491 family protein [Dyella subtropica]
MFAKRLLIGAVLATSLAACASVPYAQRMSDRQAAYAAAAGEPVRSFRFFELYSWEPLGNSQLAVYTRPNQAWLLSVSGPCPDLEFTNAIGLTSNMSEVSINFDKVLTGRTFPCTISQIRPIDVAKMRAVEHEQRKIEAASRPQDPAAKN